MGTDSQGIVAPSAAVKQESAKPTMDDYSVWLKVTHKVALSREENRYNSTALSIERAIRDSAFWKAFLSEQSSLDDSYFASTKYRLFAFSGVELFQKPWKSFYEKTYRKNVLLNDNWPEAPSDGWLLPDTWFERVHDIIRTTLVVKYLDGVEFLANELRILAKDHDVPFDYNLEARDEGYYAAHSYVCLQAPVPTDAWSVVSKSIQFEIQITTQLQEVIRRLTHQEYESRRKTLPSTATKWQWDFKGPAFTPNYLGHILHYMEGMIMEVRDRGEKNEG